MKYIFMVLFALVFSACSPKSVEPNKYGVTVEDMLHIPQNVDYFTQKIEFNETIYDVQKKYEQRYFSMWNIQQHKETVDDIKWPVNCFTTGKSYGENLQLLEQSYFDELYDNANYDKYSTVNKKAITLTQTNIRALPTIRPLLRDPSQAGEGFPFDYLQNSTIHANKPLFISHYSKDKEWVYAFSSFTSGWIKADKIAFLEKKYTDQWQKAQQVFLVKENIPLVDTDGNFLFKSKIGMMLALIDENSKYYTVLAVTSYKNNKPLFVKSKISKEIAHKGIMSLNKENLNVIISEVAKSNYGWGGLFGQRDCSSSLRDLFTPFGIWLPRNSSIQSRIGKIISLENLTDKEKIQTIKEKAIPFQTLLYKKGHIVLYVGTYENEVIIFHNTWGIKTVQNNINGRLVIGKSIFSTLEIGQYQEHYDPAGSILANLKSMNILTETN